MYLASASQMQRMDRKTIEEFGIPGFVLMENAGRGAVRFFLSTFTDLENRKVGVVCGKGNNGGDGFVMARYLACRNIPVAVYLLCAKDAVSGDAKAHMDLMTRLDVPVYEVKDQKDLLTHKTAMGLRDLWIDAIFGTGLNTEVTGFHRTVIELINDFAKPVFAVDIPSGLHPDTGQPLGVCIRAEATATFGYAKTGLVQFPGAEFAGHIRVVDIGIPPSMARDVLVSCRLLTPDNMVSRFRPRKPDSHKGGSGHLLVVAGSRGKTGAAALCAESAMRIGAGLVTLAVPQNLMDAVEIMTKEVMTLPLADIKDGCLAKDASIDILKALQSRPCLVMGPGLGLEPQTVQAIQAVIKGAATPVVLDADALNSLEGQASLLREAKKDVVITPHPREMSRLSGKTVEEIQADRLAAAESFAMKYRVHVVLKGARTVIAHPDGQMFINPTGNPALASGGTGDVLAGVIAGLITQGYPVKDAVHMGVYLHGAAADELAASRGPVGILASDIMGMLPGMMAKAGSGSLARLEFISRDL